MARIRTIKPEFPQSESMGRVSRDARLLFVMLWPICDDVGRTRAASRMLASLLFPYDDDAKGKIDGWLHELAEVGSIRLYEVDGNSYLQVENWQDHQKIDKPSKSKFPPPPGDAREPSRDFCEHSPLDQGPRTKEGIKDAGAEAPRESSFEDFFAAFPKKEDRVKSEAAYCEAVKVDTPEAILAGAKRYALKMRREKTEERFIKSAFGWLQDRRWTDGAPTAATTSAFNSPEEQAAQRAQMEKHYGQA